MLHINLPTEAFTLPLVLTGLAFLLAEATGHTHHHELVLEALEQAEHQVAGLPDHD